MKKRHIATMGCLAWLIGAITIILVGLFGLAIEWIFVCGIVKVITLCFGWTFSWGIATGIWLIVLLLQILFSK